MNQLLEDVPAPNAAEPLPHRGGAFCLGHHGGIRRERAHQLVAFDYLGVEHGRFALEHVTVGQVAALEALGVQPVVHTRITVSDNEAKRPSPSALVRLGV